MSTEHAEKVVNHIQVVHAALEKAKADREKSAADRRRAEALVPRVVEALVKHERIDEALAKQAAEQLRDPARALEILLMVADPSVTVRPPSVGAPAGAEKAAGEKRASVHFIGARRTEPGPADDRYRSILRGQG